MQIMKKCPKLNLRKITNLMEFLLSSKWKFIDRSYRVKDIFQIIHLNQWMPAYINIWTTKFILQDQSFMKNEKIVLNFNVVFLKLPIWLFLSMERIKSQFQISSTKVIIEKISLIGIVGRTMPSIEFDDTDNSWEEKEMWYP